MNGSLDTVTVPTIFGEKKVFRSSELAEAFEKGNCCVHRMPNGDVKKCVFFENIEKHIGEIRAELGGDEEVIGRQLRMDATALLNNSLVHTQGKMGETLRRGRSLCPVAFLAIVVRANTGMDIAVFQCPFVSQKKINSRKRK
jgi:hypothetical protein